MMGGESPGIPRDTRMLTLFDEIYRTQSLTRAAERLGLSQPTASIWLARLRRHWRDPLFVRTSEGMQPTPRADLLVGTVREAMALFARLASPESEFDPATARRSFRLCMTDASHITMLPALLAHVRAAAPGVRLLVAPIGRDTPALLETGDADLALGSLPGLEAGFHEQRLYAQDFVCLVAPAHPQIGATLSTRVYREAAHIGILPATSYPMVRQAYRTLGIEGRIHLEMPGFLGLAAIVSATDLVATVPRTIGETLARSGAVRVLPCPARIPPYSVSQYWHTRFHHEPGLRWLRGVCTLLFGRTGSSGRRAGADRRATEGSATVSRRVGR